MILPYLLNSNALIVCMPRGTLPVVLTWSKVPTTQVMPIESLARRIVYSVKVRIYAASHKPKYLKLW